jgi:hypothetical protein
MRVNLISPKSPVTVVTNREKAIQFARLSLITVAALFPPDADIQDETDTGYNQGSKTVKEQDHYILCGR